MGRATVHDLARAAGVSLATVDRVLNRRGGVRAATTEKVEQAVERLEGDVGLEPGVRHVVGGEPRPLQGTAAEHVEAGGDEAVPIGHRRAEVILHALAEHQLVAIVEAEREGIGRLGPFVTDWRDVAKKARAAHFDPPASTFLIKIAKAMMYVNQTFSTLCGLLFRKLLAVRYGAL